MKQEGLLAIIDNPELDKAQQPVVFCEYILHFHLTIPHLASLKQLLQVAVFLCSLECQGDG